MSGFWDTLAGKTDDSSIGDTPAQIQQAIKDAADDLGSKSNEQWGNESSADYDSGKDAKSGYGDTGGGPNVADSSDWGANSGYTYNG